MEFEEILLFVSKITEFLKSNLEYLPTILGKDFMKRYDLIVTEETKYDPNVDSSIFNGFATAAFR